MNRREFRAVLSRYYGFELLVISSLSVLICRNLFSLDERFVAGTDSLYYSFWMEPYLWRSFGGFIYAWFPFKDCGSPTIPPTPFFLIFKAFSLIVSSVSEGLVSVLTRLPIFSVFLLAGFSMFFLALTLLKSRTGALVSAIFYIFNQYFFTEIISETHLTISVGYAVAPLVFLFLERSLESCERRNILCLSIALFFLLGTLHHPILIVSLYSILYVLFWVFHPSPGKKMRAAAAVKVVSYAVVLSVLLSAYWLLPEVLFVREAYFIHSGGGGLFGTLFTVEEASFFSHKSLLDALSVRNSVESLGGQRVPYWEIPVLRPLFSGGLMLLIPALAFIAIALNRDRRTAFFTFSAITSSYLSLGIHGMPFDAFVWMWTHVPGYSTFRVSGRFLLMTSMSYAYLLGVTVAWIEARSSRLRGTDQGRSISTSVHRNVWAQLQRILRFERVFALLVVGLIISYSLVGVVEGFQLYAWPESYTNPLQWIGSQPGDFRVLTIPYGRKHASYPWVNNTEDLGLYSYGIHKKGLLVEIKYAGSDYVEFLRTLIQFNSTDMFGSLLGIAGVRYVVFEPDASQRERDFFQKQRELTANENGFLLENSAFYPHLFPAEKSALVVGGIGVLTSLLTLDGFSIGDWVLLVDESNLNHTPDQVILSNDNFLDLVFLRYGKDYLLPIKEYAFPSSNSSKYWIASRASKYRGDLVFNGEVLQTSGKNTVDIPIEIRESGSYDVWLRIAYGPDRGRLTMSVDGDDILSDFQPYSVISSGFDWIKAGAVFLTTGSHQLTLANDGSGVNEVDAVAVMRASEFQKIFNWMVDFLQQLNSRTIYILEAEKVFSRDRLDGWQPSSRWGCYASNGYTLTSDNPSEASTQLFIPKSGNYVMAVRMVGGVGYGTLILKIDEEVFTFDGSALTSGFRWLGAGPIELDAGNHSLEIINLGKGRVDLDEVMILSINNGEENMTMKDVFSSPQSTQIVYTEVNPTEFNVHIRTEEPFWLIFSETHHPLWKAYVDDREIDSTVAYSFMNGFYMDKVGEYDVRICFTGQRYLHIGALISLTSFISAALLSLPFKRVEAVALKILRRLHDGKSRLPSTMYHRDGSTQKCS